MKKKVDVLVADCSGNITIMVLSPVDRSQYKEVAGKLLENETLNGEQVAFVLPSSQNMCSHESAEAPSSASSLPHMEMCGLEFCGNASRAFAFYEGIKSSLMAETDIDTNSSNKTELPSHGTTINVQVSGCSHPLTARLYPVSPETASDPADRPLGRNSAIVEMDMPVPSGSRILTASELSIQRDGLLVESDGISHLIIEDVAPARETFETIKNRIYETIAPELPAFGVMFCDTVNHHMTPVVYVKDVDTTYFEGSCASGSVAAAFALAKNGRNGVHSFTLEQPHGILEATVTKENGHIMQITLSGQVILSDITTVDLQ